MPGFDTFESRLLIKGTLNLLTPLRIATGKSTSAVDPDQPVLKDVLGRPVIPGSSLKGSLRSYITAILHEIELQGNAAIPLTCDILSDTDNCILTAWRDADGAEGSIPDDTFVMRNSCLACRLFGSQYMAAKFSIRDSSVMSWSERYLNRDGVAIDRDTLTAMDKRKYDFEAVHPGTTFSFQAQVDNANDAELGLVLTMIKALEREQVQLGGGRSRGLGWCNLTEVEYAYHTDPIAYLLNPENPEPFGTEQQTTKIAHLRQTAFGGAHHA